MLELDVVLSRVWIPYVSPKTATDPTALVKNQDCDYQARETQPCDDAAELELLDINVDGPAGPVLAQVSEAVGFLILTVVRHCWKESVDEEPCGFPSRRARQLETLRLFERSKGCGEETK